MNYGYIAGFGNPSFLVRLSAFIARGFGSGDIPRMPGTAGTVVGLIVWIIVRAFPHLDHTFAYLVLAIVFSTIALPGIFLEIDRSGSKDPQQVVVDEIAGILVVAAFLPHATPVGLGVGFVAFRVLDILKPGPIGWADRREGALWIIVDDLAAGFFAGCACLLARVAGVPL